MALKTGFVDNKGQPGPLSVVSKTQGKCLLSVKIFVSCHSTSSRPSRSNISFRIHSEHNEGQCVLSIKNDSGYRVEKPP